MSNQILMNYQKSLDQAARLETLAEQLRRIGDEKLAEDLQEIHTSWRGDAGDIYYKKGETIDSRIVQRAKKLSEAAKLLRNSANVMYQAEMAATSVVRLRE